MLQVVQHAEIAGGGVARHGAAEGAHWGGQLAHVCGGSSAGPSDLRGGHLLLPLLAAPLLLLPGRLLLALVLERGRPKAAGGLLLLLLLLRVAHGV